MPVYIQRQPIDVYPVGLIHDLRRLEGALGVSASWCEHRAAFRRLAYDLNRGIWERVRVRKWREVKNYFNGFLAEPYEMPRGVTRCGSGWSRRRALVSLRREYDRAGIPFPVGVLHR